jgi:hypothetical protein
MVADPSLRASMAIRARAYAEQTFDIQLVTSKFESILEAQDQRGRHASHQKLGLKTSLSA